MDSEDNISRKVSVDAMSIEYCKGEVADLYGCIKASEHHEVVVYEGRGEDLSFLKAPKYVAPTSDRDNPLQDSMEQSGSERLQQKAAAKTVEDKQDLVRVYEDSQASLGRFSKFVNVITGATQCIKSAPEKEMDMQSVALSKFTKGPPSHPREEQPTRSKADKGQVNPPNLRPVKEPLDHTVNAFLEFQAMQIATKVISTKTCTDILQAYQTDNFSLLEMRLKEADAAIYNNVTSQVLRGKVTGKYMAAYNETGGFVVLDEEKTEETGKITFKTPSNDPIVVTARCTKIMLHDKILQLAEIISPATTWTVPKIRWVNGVPGCGKTTWVVKTFDEEKDVIVTTTTEAAKDLREKLTHQIGDKVKTKVRTMASVLANGFKEPDKCNRLMVDEALMNHFGAIVMATRLSGASEILLIGDVNQLPYIDRDNLFELRYCRPNLVANISQELLCSHRNPMDVAYALQDVYSGIYASRPKVHSLTLKKYSDAVILSTAPNTLFLTHTQEEKKSLTNQGFGTGEGSRILTVHEAQGLTYEKVIIVQTKAKKIRLHDSVSHAVVAVSRHTDSCVYYTDDCDDAIGSFVKRAMKASTKEIRDYVLKMALKHRDYAVVEALLKTDANAAVSASGVL